IAEGGSQSVAIVAMPQNKKREHFWMITSLACLALIAALALFQFRRPTTAENVLKLSVLPPEDRVLGNSIAISPDGKTLTFVASRPDGRTSLWIRPLDSLVAQELPGTQDAVWPFWSPDSRFIAFFASGKLKKISVSGEPLQIISDV